MIDELIGPSFEGVEDSDIQIEVRKIKEGISIDIRSAIISPHDQHIKQVIKDFLNSNNITNVEINVIDNGALDYVIKLRLQNALEKEGLM